MECTLGPRANSWSPGAWPWSRKDAKEMVNGSAYEEPATRIEKKKQTNLAYPFNHTHDGFSCKLSESSAIQTRYTGMHYGERTRVEMVLSG
ncbi:hypothetical protein WG66_008487 [Moniliophthora roreri]|nr:hypothetical protein WG66_008487 [Moniliophthora roreri]